MRRLAAGIALAALAACAHQSAPKTPPPTPAPLLAAQRGRVMPYARAREEIAFRPVIPSSQLLAVAALPGLGHDDSRRTHGIAFEYARKGHALLLREWPRQGFRIGAVCRPERFDGDTVVWTTRNASLVFALNADGPARPSVVDEEARRLTTGSACSQAVILPRSWPRRRASSWPQRSAF